MAAALPLRVRPLTVTVLPTPTVALANAPAAFERAAQKGVLKVLLSN